jgi:hypothetical protein
VGDQRFASAPGAAGAWAASAPVAVDAPAHTRFWSPFVVLVMLVALAGLAWVGGPKVLGNGGAAAAKLSYDIPYPAPSGSYRVMLPCAPETRSQNIAVLGANLPVGMAACNNDPIVFVADMAIPMNGVKFDEEAALRDAASGVGSGELKSSKLVEHNGLPALDAKIQRDGVTAYVRVVVGGEVFGTRRIVAAMVASDSSNPRGDFEHLVETLNVVS